MNRGYAFGFLIVLLVVILGLYVALTGFQASREALEAQATVPVASQGGMATRPPTREPATATATAMSLPPPVAGITVTLTAIGPLTVTETAAPGPAEPTIVVPTEAPAPTATEPLPPTEAAPAPTPISSPTYQFRVGGPPGPDPSDPNCCYIRGTVRDAAGNGLEGVQVKIFNEWNRDLPPAVTKSGAEAGQYDIPVGHETLTWYLMIIDAAGNQISPQVQIQYNAETAGIYRVDWVRSF